MYLNWAVDDVHESDCQELWSLVQEQIGNGFAMFWWWVGLRLDSKTQKKQLPMASSHFHCNKQENDAQQYTSDCLCSSHSAIASAWGAKWPNLRTMQLAVRLAPSAPP